MKKLFALMLALVMLLGMAACAEEKEEGVKGNTYVYESYVSNGETIDASEYLGGEKYYFETENSGTYSMAPYEGEVSSFPFTYTVDGSNIKVTVDYGGDMVNDIEFVLNGDKIVNTTSGPAYDADGNPIEGETITDVVTYTKE